MRQNAITQVAMRAGIIQLWHLRIGLSQTTNGGLGTGGRNRLTQEEQGDAEP